MQRNLKNNSRNFSIFSNMKEITGDTKFKWCALNCLIIPWAGEVIIWIMNY